MCNVVHKLLWHVGRLHLFSAWKPNMRVGRSCCSRDGGRSRKYDLPKWNVCHHDHPAVLPQSWRQHCKQWPTHDPVNNLKLYFVLVDRMQSDLWRNTQVLTRFSPKVWRHGDVCSGRMWRFWISKGGQKEHKSMNSNGKIQKFAKYEKFYSGASRWDAMQPADFHFGFGRIRKTGSKFRWRHHGCWFDIRIAILPATCQARCWRQHSQRVSSKPEWNAYFLKFNDVILSQDT